MNQKHGLGLFQTDLFCHRNDFGERCFQYVQRYGVKRCGTLSVLIGWTIAGIGMFALAMCFNRLSIVRPHLKKRNICLCQRGIRRIYRIQLCMGLLGQRCSLPGFLCDHRSFFALGQFFPVFGDGNTLASVIGASVIIWIFTLLIMGGVQEAVTINAVIVIAKILPILAFILLALFLGAF